MARSSVRIAKEMADIVDFIKAKHLLAGKRPPSTPAITRAIAKQIKKEELLTNEFIRF